MKTGQKLQCAPVESAFVHVPHIDMKFLPIPVLILILTLSGCSSSNSPCAGVTEPQGPFTVSGHLTFVQPMTLPSDAEVICYWPDQSVRWIANDTFNSARIFGHGTIDPQTNTFTIAMQGVPPGIQTVKRGNGSCDEVELAPPGYILLVSKSTSPKSGQNFFNNMGVLGAVDSVAVVYHASNFTMQGWLAPFPQGYAMFRDSVIIHGDTTWSTETPTPNTGLQLRIDTTSSQPSFSLPHNWFQVVVLF